MRNNDAEAAYHLPEAWSVMKGKLPVLRAERQMSAHFSLQGSDFILGGAKIAPNGLILVAMPLPQEFSDTMRQIETSQQHYLELAQQRKLVRRTYMGMLLLLTVLVLFAATWLRLFLSKIRDSPGGGAGARPRKKFRGGAWTIGCEVRAADELGELVESFNRMAAELETSRQQIVASSRELAEANNELEQRRRHMETILESIPTGVLSLDASAGVTHVNPALLRIFRPQGRGAGGPRFLVGARLGEIFPAEDPGRPGAHTAPGRPHGHDYRQMEFEP